MSIRDTFRRFQDDSGAVYVYVALLTLAMMAAMALSLDGGRFFTLNSQLQDAADASALAAAGELDGDLGARARATLAAQTGLQGTMVNRQNFATDGLGSDVQIGSEAGAILFLRRLPADMDDISSGDLATSDADARFVRVVVEQRRVDNSLSRPLTGLLSWNTRAKAVAGFTQAVCRVPPLFMCNPFESPDFLSDTMSPECQAVMGVPGAPFDPSCLPHGSQILLKTVGQGADYVPGNFGLLEPVTGNSGAANVATQLATTSPNGCFSGRVELRTGEAMGPVRAAINVRFDVYNNPYFQSKSNDPQFRPARNVTKGYLQQPTACNSTASTDPTLARGLPNDACFATATCNGNNRFGNGNWDRTGYWNTNHQNDTNPVCKQGPANLATMTRYEVYRWEIDNGCIPNNSNNTPVGEDGNPMCYMNGLGGSTLTDPSDDANDTGADEMDRRELTLAVINCVANGPISGGSGGPYPVEKFAKIFLTKPAEGQGTDQADIYGEITGVYNPGEANNVVHDIVQLYR